MHILCELVAAQEALLAEDVDLERQLEQRAQGQPLVTLVGIRGISLVVIVRGRAASLTLAPPHPSPYLVVSLDGAPELEVFIPRGVERLEDGLAWVG